jgi:hypothetical protein
VRFDNGVLQPALSALILPSSRMKQRSESRPSHIIAEFSTLDSGHGGS